MRNTTITLVLFAVVIAIFSGYFYFQYQVVLPAIHPYFDPLEKQVLNENWAEANKTLSKLQENWDKYKHFIIYNNGEQSFANFSDTMVRLDGAIKAQDKNGAIQTVNSARSAFNNFMRIVPEP